VVLLVRIEWGRIFPKNIIFGDPLSEKGQMSAPFELLVAVIIMGFVIIIGTVMMKSATDAVCLNTVNKSMTDFKNFLEDTANYRSSHKFEFRPTQCFNPAKARIVITKITGSMSCSNKCGIASDTCWVMQFSAMDISNGFYQKCLNIAAFTSFPGVNENCPTTEADLKGFDAIKTEDGVPLGTYILRNVASSAETYPKVCVYHKA